MKSIKAHRVNFFEPKPKAIRCLSYDESVSNLAVSRSDNSIEIWNVKETPILEKIIPGDDKISVETISWCKGRLFSGGLHGYVLEYDLNTLLPKHQILVTSGCPIWCMATNQQKTYLALGNDDGYVILLEVLEDSLNYEKRFDIQEGSILCLDWHKDGTIIATGSTDAIRTWDVETGHVLNRIMLSRVSKNVPTIVWCIAITSNMTIISGDSSGKTSFWDGNTGTLISSAGSKKADILSLVVSKNEDIIYTSGVEPTITTYMQSQSNGLWMKSIQRVVHTHDIRALELVGDLLISGGDDCNLVYTKYPPKIVLTFYPFCQKSYSSLASEASCILLQYPTFVELWKIGDESSLAHLLRIKSKGSEKIVSSGISSDAKWIAYSTRFQLRLFSIQIDPLTESLPSMTKVELASDIPCSSIILFSKDNNKLICYCKNKIFIIKCDLDFSNIEVTLNIDTDSAGQINIMEISNDDSYLACGSLDGNVTVYCLENLEILCKLPHYKCQSTALIFEPETKNLIIVYSDRKVVEYSIKRQAYTSWSKQEMLKEFKKASLCPITSLCFCSDTLFLSEENTIYVMNKSDQVLPAAKKIRNSENSESMLTESGFKTITKFEHISSVHSLNEELVLIQIPSSHISKELPPPIWKKMYGT